MPDYSTETRTYIGKSGTQAVDGFLGFHVNRRYTGVVQPDGLILVSIVGTQSGRGGVLLRAADWQKWFKK